MLYPNGLRRASRRRVEDDVGGYTVIDQGTKLRMAVRFPYLALSHLFQRWHLLDDFWGHDFVRRMTRAGRREIADAISEADGTGWRPLVYAICRLLYPRHVVETGVAAGDSSRHILRALHENGKGRLVSVDQPGHDRTLSVSGVKGYPRAGVSGPQVPGSLVPEPYRGRWDLVIGKTQDVLEDVLSDCGSIDIFLHDSEHTYECMMFEYRAAWEHLREGGLLLSDDVSWNPAFLDFASEIGRTPGIIGGNFGGLRR